MIGKLFHLAHLVDDLDETDRMYDQVFDCERYYRAYEKAARREASLLVVADQCMEPIQPSSALGKCRASGSAAIPQRRAAMASAASE